MCVCGVRASCRMPVICRACIIGGRQMCVRVYVCTVASTPDNTDQTDPCACRVCTVGFADVVNRRGRLRPVASVCVRAVHRARVVSCRVPARRYFCIAIYLHSYFANLFAISTLHWPRCINSCIGLRIIHRSCGFIACCADSLNVVRILLSPVWIIWCFCGLSNTCADYSTFVRMKIACFDNCKIKKRWNSGLLVFGLIDLQQKMAKLIRRSCR